jgi:hypothetical protein
VIYQDGTSFGCLYFDFLNSSAFDLAKAGISEWVQKTNWICAEGRREFAIFGLDETPAQNRSERSTRLTKKKSNPANFFFFFASPNTANTLLHREEASPSNP